MFVSVILDPGGIDSARSLVNVLINNGFKKIQRACWESMSVSETDITTLKKEIDRVTDYYDTVRIYQFPVNNMFVITELKQKKWKRCQIKNSDPSSVRTASSRTVSRSSSSSIRPDSARPAAVRTGGRPVYSSRPVSRTGSGPSSRYPAVKTRPVRKH